MSWKHACLPLKSPVVVDVDSQAMKYMTTHGGQGLLIGWLLTQCSGLWAVRA
jgi:hypothetical protein